ncbi:MAG: hypothetical protein AB1649_25125 [Chloroflexota bacterium]
MNPQETVQALMVSVQKGRFDEARSYLSDQFQFSGTYPEPADAETWLGLSFSLRLAFTQLDYRFKVESAQGNVVNATMQLSGLHRGAFDLTGINRGVISATNRNFSTVTENNKITVKNGKVSSWEVEPNGKAGLKEILSQLGEKLPKAEKTA